MQQHISHLTAAHFIKISSEIHSTSTPPGPLSGWEVSTSIPLLSSLGGLNRCPYSWSSTRCPRASAHPSRAVLPPLRTPKLLAHCSPWERVLSYGGPSSSHSNISHHVLVGLTDRPTPLNLPAISSSLFNRKPLRLLALSPAPAKLPVRTPFLLQSRALTASSSSIPFGTSLAAGPHLSEIFPN